MNSAFMSERLEMRLWGRKDLPIFHRLWGDPRVIWWRGTALSWADSRAIFDKLLDKIAGMPSGLGWWVVRERESGEPVGSVMLQPFGVGEVEIGVQILFDKWGKGYGTECVGAALDYIFDSSEIERVLAVVHVENEPSKKMVTRCGMVEEGFVMHAKLPHIRYIISRP